MLFEEARKVEINDNWKLRTALCLLPILSTYQHIYFTRYSLTSYDTRHTHFEVITYKEYESFFISWHLLKYYQTMSFATHQLN